MCIWLEEPRQEVGELPTLVKKKTQNKFSTEFRLIECPALNMAPSPNIQPILKFPVRNSEEAPVSDKLETSLHQNAPETNEIKASGR